MKEIKPEDNIELLEKLCPPPTEEVTAKLEENYAALKKVEKKVDNPYDSPVLKALEKIDHTVCLNKTEYGLDKYDGIDCKDVFEFVDCYELVERALVQRHKLIKILRKHLIFYGDGGVALKGLSNRRNKQDYNFLLDLCKQG